MSISPPALNSSILLPMGDNGFVSRAGGAGPCGEQGGGIEARLARSGPAQETAGCQPAGHMQIQLLAIELGSLLGSEPDI